MYCLASVSQTDSFLKKTYGRVCMDEGQVVAWDTLGATMQMGFYRLWTATSVQDQPIYPTFLQLSFRKPCLTWSSPGGRCQNSSLPCCRREEKEGGLVFVCMDRDVGRVSLVGLRDGLSEQAMESRRDCPRISLGCLCTPSGSRDNGWSWVPDRSELRAPSSLDCPKLEPLQRDLPPLLPGHFLIPLGSWTSGEPGDI